MERDDVLAITKIDLDDSRMPAPQIAVGTLLVADVPNARARLERHEKMMRLTPVNGSYSAGVTDGGPRHATATGAPPRRNIALAFIWCGLFAGACGAGFGWWADRIYENGRAEGAEGLLL